VLLNTSHALLFPKSTVAIGGRDGMLALVVANSYRATIVLDGTEPAGFLSWNYTFSDLAGNLDAQSDLMTSIIFGTNLLMTNEHRLHSVACG
jgi:hypothetical protein